MLASKVPRKLVQVRLATIDIRFALMVQQVLLTVLVLQVVLPQPLFATFGLRFSRRYTRSNGFELVRTNAPNLSFWGVLYYNCKCFTTHLAFLIDLAKILCPDTNSPAPSIYTSTPAIPPASILHSYATRADVRPVPRSAAMRSSEKTLAFFCLPVWG
jgi:hypothetical protein